MSDSVVASQELVIRYLVGELAAQEKLSALQTKEPIRRILARERLGSTILPNGRVVNPHTKASVPKVLEIMGSSAIPITWEGAPAFAAITHVCLLLLPDGQPTASLRAMEHVTKLMSNI
ncbi:MAG: PTS sugar transporter subunit IIA [Gemmataceae bacterium]